MEEVELCTLCNLPLVNETDEVVQVHQKGLESLIKKSKEKDDIKFKFWENAESFKFHAVCRNRYSASSDKTSFIRKQTLPTFQEPSTSSHQQSLDESVKSNFNFAELCLICGKKSHRDESQIHAFSTNHFLERLSTAVDLRDKEIVKQVKDRLQGINSLVSVKAHYHKICLRNFFANPPKKPKIREEDPETLNTLNIVCKYIEESNETKFKLSTLRQVMGKNVIANRRLYGELESRYGNDIRIRRAAGKDAIIYYKNKSVASYCNDPLEDIESLAEADKKRILRTASEILKSKIMAQAYDAETYRAPGNFLDNVVDEVPNSLNYFLSELLLRKRTDNDSSDFIKRDNIAHAIISSLRPESFNSYLQLAVSTYLHKKSGSKLIIDLLSKLGVSASYDNAQLFEASAMMNPPKMVFNDVFAQYVFDKTIVNADTPDGKKTFCCIEGIAVYTPEDNVKYTGPIKKCKKKPSAAQLASCHSIDTVPLMCSQASGLKTIVFEDVSTLIPEKSDQLPPHYAFYLWGKATLQDKIPCWNGFMEALYRDSPHNSVARIVCMPFINEPSSKQTSVNTAIVYAMEDCKRRHQNSCIVTFDQPLFIEACEIVAGNDAMKNVVIRLGGFHTLTYFLAAIGHIMDGSGLENAWSMIYAHETLKGIMSGFSFSRALRAHILTYTAIGLHLIEHVNEEMTLMDRKEYHAFLRDRLQSWDSNPPRYDDCADDPILSKMRASLLDTLESLKSNGPTAQLFVQYFNMVTIALQFMEAERTGNWELHLQSIEKMIPYFHASGHYCYAKSAQIYLQSMVKLEKIMDHDEYRKFTEEGGFTIRRSSEAWSGVWSDLTIEQSLNRFFGAEFKHGKGLTPKGLARYLTCMPVTFPVMDGLESYCDLNVHSDHHIDLNNSGSKKDNRALMLLNNWLLAHKPFENRQSLTSLSTGVVGNEDVNCHEALKLGQLSMATMIGQNAQNVSFSLEYKVKPISATSNCANKRCGCRKASMCGNGTKITCNNTSDIFNRSNVQDVDHHDENNGNSGSNHGDDPDNSQDTDDESREHKRSEQRGRYLKIKDVLCNDDSDEDIEDTENGEMDFDIF